MILFIRIVSIISNGGAGNFTPGSAIFAFYRCLLLQHAVNGNTTSALGIYERAK